MWKVDVLPEETWDRGIWWQEGEEGRRVFHPRDLERGEGGGEVKERSREVSALVILSAGR